VDFFFWDFMKDIIYKEKVQQVADLQWWITVAIAAAALDMLAQVWTEVEYHCLQSSLHCSNRIALNDTYIWWVSLVVFITCNTVLMQ
jgi:hypothetical protein